MPSLENIADLRIGAIETRNQVVFDLLQQSQRWRVRSVERIDLPSALWAERRRSVQVAPLRDVLSPYVGENDKHAKLFLPAGNHALGLLLDFDVTVAGNPAYLLPRPALGYFETQYLQYLATQGGHQIDGSLVPLIQAICEFQVGPWRFVHRADRKNREKRKSADGLTELLCQYLTAKGLADRFGQAAITPADVHPLQCAIEPLQEIVRENSPTDIESPSEYPLLVLANLERGLISNRGEAQALLERLRNVLVQANTDAVANQAQSPNYARQFVEAYCDYGQHWDALVECTVPLDEPFMIKTAQKTALRFAKPKNGIQDGGSGELSLRRRRIHQLVNVNDAQSTHVNVRVTDTDLELIPNKWRAFDEKYGADLSAAPDCTDATEEVVAFYLASPEGERRERRLWVEVAVRPTVGARATNSVIFVLALTAIVGFSVLVFHAFSVGGAKKLSGGDVAVLLVPSAVAAALLLVRQSTTLGAVINRKVHVATAVLLGVLWLMTLVLYSVGKISFGDAAPAGGAATPSVTASASPSVGASPAAPPSR